MSRPVTLPPLPHLQEDPVSFAIQIAHVLSAAEQPKGAAVRPPLLEFDTLHEPIGPPVPVKFDGAQQTGPFNFLGPSNPL